MHKFPLKPNFSYLAFFYWQLDRSVTNLWAMLFKKEKWIEDEELGFLKAKNKIYVEKADLYVSIDDILNHLTYALELNWFWLFQLSHFNVNIKYPTIF